MSSTIMINIRLYEHIIEDILDKRVDGDCPSCSKILEKTKAELKAFQNLYNISKGSTKIYFSLLSLKKKKIAHEKLASLHCKVLAPEKIKDFPLLLYRNIHNPAIMKLLSDLKPANTMKQILEYFGIYDASLVLYADIIRIIQSNVKQTNLGNLDDTQTALYIMLKKSTNYELRKKSAILIIDRKALIEECNEVFNNVENGRYKTIDISQPLELIA